MHKEIAEYLAHIRMITSTLSKFDGADKEFVRGVEKSNKRFDKWITFLNQEAEKEE